MKKGKLIAIVMLVAVVAMALLPFVISWFWSWIIPDLFAGAVQQGLIAEKLSWFSGLKIFLGLSVMGSVMKGSTVKM
jgi:ABC-type multidrug transport system fused ATPase/permease subunit